MTKITELTCIPLELQVGHFFYIMKNQKPRTLDDQLSTLKNRGMHFLNEQLAKEFLNRISYFRLKYFWIDMLDMESGDFKKDIYFEDVIDRYELDKSFRQIIFDAIETLEIGLRTRIGRKRILSSPEMKDRV